MGTAVTSSNVVSAEFSCSSNSNKVTDSDDDSDDNINSNNGKRDRSVNEMTVEQTDSFHFPVDVKQNANTSRGKVNEYMKISNNNRDTYTNGTFQLLSSL
jgi:hypothetical protein